MFFSHVLYGVVIVANYGDIIVSKMLVFPSCVQPEIYPW